MAIEAELYYRQIETPGGTEVKAVKNILFAHFSNTTK